MISGGININWFIQIPLTLEANFIKRSFKSKDYTTKGNKKNMIRDTFGHFILKSLNFSEFYKSKFSARFILASLSKICANSYAFMQKKKKK